MTILPKNWAFPREVLVLPVIDVWINCVRKLLSWNKLKPNRIKPVALVSIYLKFLNVVYFFTV